MACDATPAVRLRPIRPPPPRAASASVALGRHVFGIGPARRARRGGVRGPRQGGRQGRQQPGRVQFGDCARRDHQARPVRSHQHKKAVRIVLALGAILHGGSDCTRDIGQPCIAARRPRAFDFAACPPANPANPANRRRWRGRGRRRRNTHLALDTRQFGHGSKVLALMAPAPTLLCAARHPPRCLGAAVPRSRVLQVSASRGAPSPLAQRVRATLIDRREVQVAPALLTPPEQQPMCEAEVGVDRRDPREAQHFLRVVLGQRDAAPPWRRQEPPSRSDRHGGRAPPPIGQRVPPSSRRTP